jgi:hypothetical protein
MKKELDELKKSKDESISTDFCEDIDIKEKLYLEVFDKKDINMEDLFFEKEIENFDTANLDFFNLEKSDRKLFQNLLHFLETSKQKSLNKQVNLHQKNKCKMICEVYKKNDKKLDTSSFSLDNSLEKESNLFFDHIIKINHPLFKKKTERKKKPFGFTNKMFCDKKFSFENSFRNPLKKLKFN